jgi:16S rRNA processing protein RimM
MTEKFIIGQVGAPFGIKGFVKVRSTSGETDHLLILQSVILRKDGKERIFKIEEISITPPAVLMRFEGISTPEEAKTLNGAQLLADREQAAPLDDGEFYIEDLKGLPVVCENGTSIGFITDIIEGGGGELAEIALSNGEKRLVPFRKEFFPEINLENKTAVLQNLWCLDP